MSALWAVALIMLLSGAAKLRSREDVGAVFTRLKVPRALAAPWLARAFPWLELLLGLALLLPFPALRPLVGAAAVALFTAFLVLVVRAKDDGVSCGCFGEASAAPISRWTIVRNVLFLALAVLALVEGIVSFLTHDAVAWVPLTAFGSGAWAWALLVALLLAAAAFLAGRESVSPADDPDPFDAGAPAAATAPVAGAPAAPEGGDGPERRPFPAAVVVSDSSYRSLHDVVAEGAVVALRLSPGCGSCSSVIAQLPDYVDRLGPVRPRVLVPRHGTAAEHAPHRGQIPAELVLEDPGAGECQGLGLSSFPSAVLLGTDRLTAGGPVFGADAVLEFLDEIAEIMAAELPAAQTDHDHGGHRP